MAVDVIHSENSSRLRLDQGQEKRIAVENGDGQRMIQNEAGRQSGRAFERWIAQAAEEFAASEERGGIVSEAAKNAASPTAKDAADVTRGGGKRLAGAWQQVVDQVAALGEGKVFRDSSGNGGASHFLGQGRLAASALKEFSDLTSDFQEVLAATGSSLSSFVQAEASLKEASGGLKTAIPASFYSPEWKNMFSERVEWIIGQKVQEATITVNPAHLGPIEVSIRVEDGKTSTAFFSQNPQVREAIESSLPKLEQMLAGSGVSLGDTQVAAEAFRDRQDQAFSAQRGQSESVEPVSVETTATYLSTVGPVRSFDKTLQLVDTFV